MRRDAPPRLAGRTALTLRLQAGCDEACSYCIIPTTRGRSLPLDRVLREVRVAVAAGYKEIAPAGVHLGSDAMLRAMRRPYTSAAFPDLLGSIHDRLPHAAIGTDVIVGFPGETDGTFLQTLELVERLPLSHVHVFL